MASDHLVIQRDEGRGESSGVLADPPVGNLLDGHGIEIVPLGPSLPCGDHQIGLRKHRQVLHHSEARHLGEVLAELIECLPILTEEAIEKDTSGGVGQRTENLGSLVHARMICDYMVTYQGPDNRWKLCPSRSGRIAASRSCEEIP